MAEMTIVWDTPAKTSFRKQIKYIAQDSIQNAEQVRKEILSAIDLIPAHPEKFAPDKFKINNDDSYRAFEQHNLRIAYFIGIKEIRVLRVRHVKKDPKPF